MATVKYEFMWDLISKFEFNKCDEIQDVLCLICKKLLCRPHIALCGCQYCGNCIKEYLENKSTHCPGTGNDCSAELLDMDKNVVKDLAMCRYIAKIVLKCPYSSCEIKTELENMNDHLAVCSEKPLTCPFEPIGCNEEEIVGQEISGHLQVDSVKHSLLLLDSVKELSKKLDNLQQILEFKDVEIKRWRDNCEEKEVLIEQLRNEMNTKMDSYKSETALRISKMEEAMIERDNARVLQNQMVIVGQEHLQENSEVKHFQILFDELEKVIRASTNYEQEIFRRLSSVIKLNKLCPHLSADFVWRIDDFSTKRKCLLQYPYFYSDPFYADDYKMCLYVVFRDQMELRCHLMKWDNDDDMEWPMRKSIRLSIIDQHTLKSFKSKSYKIESYKEDKTAFNQPTKNMNVAGIGCSQFVSMADILDEKGVTLNNSILLSCVIGDCSS